MGEFSGVRGPKIEPIPRAKKFLGPLSHNLPHLWKKGKNQTLKRPEEKGGAPLKKSPAP